ncbi:hypothetical protein FOZ60_003207 [Perkinsus olseni]|uniref:Alpha/beta hydrolase fold-3 domain-containing protein n=1 Tax=Perkinsus olseni TaxID=32597 RepID=A0A7J6NWV1_PEROL|nr:hypothetical protein FOZ60_003207 [Perkinsus olseni]
MHTGLTKIIQRVAKTIGQSQVTFMADRALANWFGRYLGKYWQRKYKFELKKVEVSPSCTAHVLTRIATQVTPEPSRWLMFLHGGGFCMLDPRFYYGLAAHIARDGRFEGVVIPDFRLSPDFGYPAQLEDCLSTYKWMRDDQKAGKVAIAGDSSGGNLAAAVTLKKKDTPPEAVALLSPFLDMTISGETYDLNADTDRLVSKTNATRAAEMYSMCLVNSNQYQQKSSKRRARTRSCRPCSLKIFQPFSTPPSFSFMQVSVKPFCVTRSSSTRK